MIPQSVQARPRSIVRPATSPSPGHYNRNRLAYPMLLPAVIGILLVNFIPMLWGLYISFKDYNKYTLRQSIFDLEWVGLQQYSRALETLTTGFISSLQTTLAFTVLSVSLAALFGLGAALIANRTFRGRTLFRGVLLIPYILPGVVALTTLRFMLTSDGVINYVLQKLNLISDPVFWLVGENSFWAILAGSVWTRWPLFFLVFLAALQTIPAELYEASEVDGASAWQKFSNITVPYLKSVSVIIIMFSSLWAYNDYLTPFVMLGGSSAEVPAPASLLSVEILQESFQNLNFSYGAAMSLLMTVLAIAFAIVYLRRANPEAVDMQVTQSSPVKWFNRVLSFAAVGILIFLLGPQLGKVASILALLTGAVLLIRVLLALSQRVVLQVLHTVGVVFYLTIVLFPLYWLVISSLKSEAEIRQVTFIPETWTWENYVRVWNEVPLGRYFGNSVGLSVLSMVGAVIIATMAGYAFSRFRFKGRGLFGLSVLSTQLFPGVLLLLPFFLIFSDLQRTPLFEEVLQVKFIGRDTYWGNMLLMLLTYTASVLPFTLWVMRGYMDSIPVDLEEAAEVDGSTRFGAFLKVAVPLAVPGIATVAILAFTRGWNEVLFSSMMTNEMTRTVALGIQDFRTETTVQWNLTMAAGVLISLPVLFFFTFLQRYLISGLTAGAVKS